MTQIVWGRPEDRIYEAGVDRGVLYPASGPGVAWNGLVSVVETPEESNVQKQYQDGIKTYARLSDQEYSSTLEAYTYPDEFEQHDGLSEVADGLWAGDQPRVPFNLSYRTKIGDSQQGMDAGYKIHLLYNAVAQPSTKSYMSLSETPDVSTFSWRLTSFAPSAPAGFKPSSHFIVDTRKTGPLALRHLERILYGDNNPPRMPTITQLFNHFNDWHVLYPSSSTYPSTNTYPGGR